MRVYRLEARRLTEWGDYGDMLVHGMTMHLDRVDGMIRLERTGPFVPPFSVGMHVVVTDETRRRLQDSGLTGAAFLPVVKARIVHLPWEEWDRRVAEPPLYPKSGEPEDYILERPHDPRTAQNLGDLYEVVVAKSGRMERVADSRETIGYTTTRLIPESWDGSDFFGAEGVMHTFVSERAKRWLEEAFPDYVSFSPA